MLAAAFDGRLGAPSCFPTSPVLIRGRATPNPVDSQTVVVKLQNLFGSKLAVATIMGSDDFAQQHPD